jgi:hypothetical protein
MIERETGEEGKSPVAQLVSHGHAEAPFETLKTHLLGHVKSPAVKTRGFQHPKSGQARVGAKKLKKLRSAPNSPMKYLSSKSNRIAGWYPLILMLNNDYSNSGLILIIHHD